MTGTSDPDGPPAEAESRAMAVNPSAAVTDLVDACLTLVRAHHHLVGNLQMAGLVPDHTAVALTARRDQIDAIAADLHRLPRP
jgi:hypothetical protein